MPCKATGGIGPIAPGAPSSTRVTRILCPVWIEGARPPGPLLLTTCCHLDLRHAGFGMHEGGVVRSAWMDRWLSDRTDGRFTGSIRERPISNRKAQVRNWPSSAAPERRRCRPIAVDSG